MTLAPTPALTPTPAPTPTPSPTPTPTPIPDSDRDGILDPIELRLGTNPFQRDSDTDGIDDGDEVELGSDPLFPDTDRDGVVDGDDVLPLADAKVRVSIAGFTDQTRREFLHGDTNAYFTIFVGNNEPVVTPVYPDVQNQRIQTVLINVPDNLRSLKVGVLAQEHTPLANFIEGKAIEMVITSITGLPIPIASGTDDPYDISGAPGTDLNSHVLIVDIDANSSTRVTGDGTSDRESDGLEARITVTIDHGH